MITIFAIPKPFDGHVGMIQRNALESWARLDDVEVLLLGDDDGVAEAAHEIGARHVREVEKSAHGTPLVSSAFQLARNTARHDVLAYANADIILFPDVVDAVRAIHFRQFLLVGQRLNADLRAPIAFDDPMWQQKLRETVAGAELANESWIDYFVLPRDSSLIDDLPPFAVGRPMWDNWLIREARLRRVPLIDGTSCITAVHQRHDYTHVPGGTGRHWEGPEAAANTDLFGSGTIFGIRDATHVLRGRRPVPALGVKHLRRRWETRHEVDGNIERVGRWMDPALAPARLLRREKR